MKRKATYLLRHENTVVKKLIRAVLGLSLSFIGILVAEEDLFKIMQIQLGQQVLLVEVADTQDKHNIGLMHRQSLGENEGMLFVFSKSRPRTFWMKNTFIPLSVGIFDEYHKLVEILKLEPPPSDMQVRFPVTTSRHSAQYALEVRQGWFAQNHVRPGMIFNFLND